MSNAREYSIPLGTPIRRCACGVRVCHVPTNSDKDAPLVTIEYSRGVNFEAWGAEHRCAPHACEPENLSPRVTRPEMVAEPVSVPRGDLKGAFCKGRGCGRVIYFRTTEDGTTAPKNADGSLHECTSSTRYEAVEYSMWNGDNESPSEQIETRKAVAHKATATTSSTRTVTQPAPRKSRAMPRLSVDLTQAKHPFICQSCGVENSETRTRHIKSQPNDLMRWREHDEDDVAENVVVVLCVGCSEKLIDPHPRLYGDLQRHQPWPGCMPLCVDCVNRDGTRCTHPDLKSNGGAGLKMHIPTPTVAFMDGRRGPKGGKRVGWREVFYFEDVKQCDGKISAAM